jgi:hypothetical protein
MGHIFISYAHRDQVWADAYADSLRDCGYEVWVDQKKIRLTEKWRQEIEDGIDQADTVHVIVTENIKKSDYCCKKEIPHAVEKEKRLVPVILTDGLETVNSELVEDQGVDFRGVAFDTAFRTLVEKLSQIGYPPTRNWDFEALRQSPDYPTLDKLAETWNSKRQWRSNKQAYIGIVIGRTGYGEKAYVVAPPEAPLVPRGRAQVFLWFNGTTTENSFQKFLDYKTANEESESLWTVLIAGPYKADVHGNPLEYRLPPDKAVWQQSLIFIDAMINRATNNLGQPLEFFLSTPNALVMVLGETFKNRRQFVPYHYDVYATDFKRYYYSIK